MNDDIYWFLHFPFSSVKQEENHLSKTCNTVIPDLFCESFKRPFCTTEFMCITQIFSFKQSTNEDLNFFLKNTDNLCFSVYYLQSAIWYERPFILNIEHQMLVKVFHWKLLIILMLEADTIILNDCINSVQIFLPT